MSHVKHKSKFSPNVGTALFLLTGLAAPISHAAYTVIDYIEISAVPARSSPSARVDAAVATVSSKVRQAWTNNCAHAHGAESIHVGCWR